MGPAGSDDDLRDVLRAKSGDRDAFAALVERHARRVHDLARRMLRDAHEAEDVVQRAFWNAWRALDRFDASRPFSHWLLRIATNLCRNRYAWRKRRPEVAMDVEPAVSAGADEPDRGSSERLRQRVRTALDALPARYRLPAVLRYVHDLPLEAIAEITGDPVATVKTHLHRARAALKSLLGPETSGPAGGTTPGSP